MQIKMQMQNPKSKIQIPKIKIRIQIQMKIQIQIQFCSVWCFFVRLINKRFLPLSTFLTNLMHSSSFNLYNTRAPLTADKTDAKRWIFPLSSGTIPGSRSPGVLCNDCNPHLPLLTQKTCIYVECLPLIHLTFKWVNNEFEFEFKCKCNCKSKWKFKFKFKFNFV